MPNVGDVIAAVTKNVIGREAALKHHLCVCDQTHQYLYVCSRQYTDDFPLDLEDCPGLDLKTSYVSLSRVLFCPSFKSPALTCHVSPAYLKALFDHVTTSKVMSPRDKTKIIVGLAPHLPKPPREKVW